MLINVLQTLGPVIIIWVVLGFVAWKRHWFDSIGSSAKVAEVFETLKSLLEKGDFPSLLEKPLIEKSALAKADFDAVGTEKQQRLGSRWQYWSLVGIPLAAVGYAFSAGGFHVGVVTCCILPAMLYSVSLIVGSSEDVLDQNKLFLIWVDVLHGHIVTSQEWFNRICAPLRKSGGQVGAFQQTVLLCQVFGVIFAEAGLWVQLQSWPFVLVGVICGAILAVNALLIFRSWQELSQNRNLDELKSKIIDFAEQEWKRRSLEAK